MTQKIQKTDAEWKALLKEKGAESVAFDVTRHAGTERAFSGKYETVWADGTYHCMCCGEKLFESQTKFDSGCGWPSFSQLLTQRQLPNTSTTNTACDGLKRCVQTAARIWGTFLMTVRLQPGCATV